MRNKGERSEWGGIRICKITWWGQMCRNTLLMLVSHFLVGKGEERGGRGKYSSEEEIKMKSNIVEWINEWVDQ